MRRESGVTMIELMIGIALLAILMFMLSPIITSSNKAHQTAKRTSEFDAKINRSVDTIKGVIRKATLIDASETGFVKIAIPNDSGTQDVVVIYYDVTAKKLSIGNATTYDVTNKENSKNLATTPLATGVKSCAFGFEQGIFFMDIEFEIDGVSKTISDSVVSRISRINSTP